MDRSTKIYFLLEANTYFIISTVAINNISFIPNAPPLM